MGMLYLYSYIFLTDIIGYDQLNFSLNLHPPPQKKSNMKRNPEYATAIQYGNNSNMILHRWNI